MKIRFAGILIFILSSLVVSGCFNEDNPAVCSYQITISGISNYSSTDATQILIPAPMMDGEPIFTDKDLQNLRLDGWNASINNSEYGEMISFQTNRKNLKDINIKYPNDTLSRAISDNGDTLANKSIKAKKLLASYPLKPMILKLDTNYSFAENISIGNYTSYIFIDNTIIPNNGNRPIEFSLRLLISEGRTRGQFGKTYTIEVHEIIRKERGWIPVRVEYVNVYP